MNSVPKVDFIKKPCNTKRKRFEIEVRKLIRFGSVNIRFKVEKKSNITVQSENGNITNYLIEMNVS